ncbi:MAG TPA: hypothetical protein VFZ79_14100 [Acidimicrobiales bacterium]
MSSGQWRVPGALTVALLVTSVLVAPAAAQTSDGTGEAPRPRALVLEPVTGPPGTPVTVSGDGFGACRSQYDDVSSGAVEITWDGSSLATVGVASGRVSAVVQVPDAAPPGTATVAGTCLGDSELTRSAEFTVTAPGRTTDPAETTDDTARTTDGTTPATGADAEVPSPTAGDVGGADPMPQPADPEAVDATEAASRTDDGPPAAQIAALLVVLAAAAALLSRAIRRSRGPEWATTHVSAVPGTTTQGAVAVAPPPKGSPPASVVRLEPRSGTVTHVLEEVDR